MVKGWTPGTAALLAMCAGCAVGPDFRPPAPPEVGQYTRAPLPATTAAADSIENATVGGGAAQHIGAAQDLPTDWWTLFHSTALSSLVEQALQRNPGLAGAEATLREARENLAAGRAVYLPTLQASYAAVRQRDPVGTLAPTLNGAVPPAIFNLYTGQVSVSYVLDVFGQNRRQVESLGAAADAQRFEYEATYLTLTASVVLGAINEASLRDQLTATRAIAGSEHEVVAILQRQQALGAVAMTDVLAAEAALAQTEASLPALEKQLAQQDDQIAVLAGWLPAEAVPVAFTLDDFTLPTDLPLSLPSALVAQRPDVLLAESNLHEATAEVGVAIGNFLPQIAIAGGAGGVSTLASELTATGNVFWSAGASLSQVLFAGGSLVHRKRAADAALDAAGAHYRTAVLGAFQNTADTLEALVADGDGVRTGAAALDAAARSRAIAKKNLELGSVSYLAWLNAEQAYQQALIGLTQARAARYADTVGLYAALGGGWWSHTASP